MNKLRKDAESIILTGFEAEIVFSSVQTVIEKVLAD